MFKLVARQGVPTSMRGKYAATIMQFINSNDKCAEVILDDVQLNSAYISFNHNLSTKFKNYKIRVTKVNNNLYLIKE